jgi:chemotaxis protein methyltransferase CheR
MDVIFCCNVLMYFSPDAARQAVDRLHQCLRAGGWLFVGPAETSQALFRAFEPVFLPEGTAYRRPPATPTAEPVVCKQTTAVSVTAETSKLGTWNDTAEPAAADHTTSVTPPVSRNRMPAMVRLARACANRGNLREAFRWCEMAIATGQADARVHYLRAAILQEQGLLDEAVRSLRRAIYLEPGFVMGHFALGNLAAGLGRLKESAKHFENTMALLLTQDPSAILPESGGLTAARLKDMVTRRINA